MISPPPKNEKFFYSYEKRKRGRHIPVLPFYGSSGLIKTLSLPALAEYDQSRDEDKYLATMEAMADDFRHGIMKRDYPASIANDGDAKAFYGSIITIFRSNTDINITHELEEMIAGNARIIKQAVSDNAKRDWKHNEVVHKQIRRALDDCLFDMCDQIGFMIDKTNVDVIDLMIDEIMKVALTRY